jgi:peroxiredoxin
MLAAIAAVLIWRIVFVTPEAGMEPNVPGFIEPNRVTAPLMPMLPIKPSLAVIVKNATTWEPGFSEWIGKAAPEIDLYDTQGKPHKLSSYKGKRVLLVFWATWCGPCRQEIPGLISLRKEFGEDQLAILAISFEPGSKVKSFLAQMPVNYVVIAAPQEQVEEPYRQVDGIPAAFYVDKNGMIRLASIGMVSEDDTRAILAAIE